MAPVLRPGDMLVGVPGNMPAHRLNDLRPWLAECGVEVVFLPHYSPDFAPSRGRLGASSKPAPGGPEPQLRGPRAALEEAVTWISSQEARNRFDRCGYHNQQVK